MTEFWNFFKFTRIVQIYAWFFIHCRNHHGGSHAESFLVCCVGFANYQTYHFGHKLNALLCIYGETGDFECQYWKLRVASQNFCGLFEWHRVVKTGPLKSSTGKQITWGVIKWKHFPRYWPIVRGIHRSPVKSSHKSQWRGDLSFFLICAWINRWLDNHEARYSKRHRAHYNVIVMKKNICVPW